MNLRHATYSILVATALASAPAAFAADEYNVSSGVTTAGAALGLHGADPVALGSTGDVVRGTAAHTAVQDGVACYFADAMSKEKFEANPAQYLPQFGGFCAFAVALGKKFDGDPHYADIVDDKIYVFVNADVFEAYKKDKAATLEKAHATWDSIRSVPVTEL